MGTKNLEQTPIVMLTAKQLKDFLFGDDEKKTPTTSKREVEDGKHYLYSIRHLAKFLNVSYTTAWKLKKTVLKPAVYQRGRVIMIDTDKVMELMAEHGND